MDIHVRTPTITRPNRCVDQLRGKSALTKAPAFSAPPRCAGFQRRKSVAAVPRRRQFADAHLAARVRPDKRATLLPQLSAAHTAHGEPSAVAQTTRPWPTTGWPAAAAGDARSTGPGCGDLVLQAEHEPRNPDEWEQWSTATRKAMRRQAIAKTRPGTPTNAPQSDSPTPTAEVASQTAPGGAPATQLPA